ncbi:MAG: hypothetical protein AAF581_18365 [Planctomycetota bacterium]
MAEFKGGPGAAGQPQAQSSSLLKIFGIGCLIIFAILLIGGVYAALNWRSMVGSAFRAGFDETIKELDLSKEQDQRLRDISDRVIAAFEDERISADQIGQVVEEFSHSPAVIIVPIAVFGGKYIDPSQLSDTEKEAGWLTIERYARGIQEGVIDPDDLKKIGLPMNENRQLTEISDEELRALLGRMKGRADDAAVPEEHHEIDIATALEEAVTAVLGEGWDQPRDPPK